MCNLIEHAVNSGGSRGGARGALFWVKKEEMTEGKMAGRASKSRPPPPPPPPPPPYLAQGLDPPLVKGALNGTKSHMLVSKLHSETSKTKAGGLLSLKCVGSGSSAV